MFNIIKQVAFYETDMMGVVHHSNYFKYFEDARLAWLTEKGLISEFSEKEHVNFAVIDAQAKYIKPLKYGQIFQVHMQVRKIKARLEFGYFITLNSENEKFVVGKTEHVSVDKDLKVCKVPAKLQVLLESEEWIEI